MMKLTLTPKQVEKILSTMSTQQIEEALDANWEYWSTFYNGCEFELTKKGKDDKTNTIG